MLVNFLCFIIILKLTGNKVLIWMCSHPLIFYYDIFLDPGQVSNLTVPSRLPDTMFNATWLEPFGGVDVYEVTLSFNESSINMTATEPNITLSVEHGFMFTVSVVAIWQNLSGQPDDVTDVVGMT